MQRNSVLGLNKYAYEYEWEGCADGLFRVCTQKNTVDDNMYVSSNNLVSVYETGLVLRSLMA